jgi:prefoldin subunit 5
MDVEDLSIEQLIYRLNRLIEQLEYVEQEIERRRKKQNDKRI